MTMIYYDICNTLSGIGHRSMYVAVIDQASLIYQEKRRAVFRVGSGAPGARMVWSCLHQPGGPRGSKPWYNRWFLVVATANLVGATISVIDDKPIGFSDDLNVAGASTKELRIREIAVKSSEPNALSSPDGREQPSDVQRMFWKHQAVQPADRVRRLASDSQSKIAQWFHTLTGDRKVAKTINMSTIRIRVLCLGFAAIATMSTLWLMMPAGPQGHTNHRNPPRWEPGLEGSLPFRTWLQDLLLWTITTDLEPHRQAAAIIAQLGGAARELARTLSPQEIFNGGVVNGQHLDPVSFLIHGLSERFSPLDDEIRVRAAQDLLQFGRRGNESVDVLVSRLETIRCRARAEGGGANISTESALILLRAVGVSSEQFQRLTQPFGLRLPNTEQEFSQLLHGLRRMGHIVEHHPGNIATSLHRPAQSSSNQSYVSFPDQEPPMAASSHSSWSFVGQSHPTSEQPWNMPMGGPMPQQHQTEDWAFYIDPNADGASDTDSATESDDGGDAAVDSEIQHMSPQEADEWLFWQYAEAKRKWRHHTGKPVRALRRVLRRKGKGKGKHAFYDIAATLQQSTFFKGRGKGSRTSGKGFGRRINPKGRDGQILKCSICQSQYHLRAKCPQRNGQRGNIQPTSSSQMSQLPFPPSGNRPQAPSMTGFVSAQSVTASDGEIGSASLHFMTSEAAAASAEDEQVETPRQSRDPEVHNMTPPDPWSDWHDPWSNSRTEPQASGAYPTEQTVPGVWPPMNFGGFPGSSQLFTTPTTIRPEVGPSLLPASESHMMTRLFGTVAEQRSSDTPVEERQDNNASTLQEHQEWLRQYLQPYSPHMPGATLFVRTADITAAQRALFEPPPNIEPSSQSGTAGMFSQVFELRQTRSSHPVAESVDIQDAAMNASGNPQHEDNVVPVVYEGDESECSICQVVFSSRESVVRLVCRHIFHQECFDEYIARADSNPSCPNCRGSPTVTAVFRYIMPAPTPTRSVDHSVAASPETGFHTPESAFPWWPVPTGSQPKASAQPAYHTTTHRTEGGQLGLLVDPGSYGNLVGDQWLATAVKEAQRSGFKASHKGMTSPLEVGGVGSGTQQCRQQVTIPAAISAADGTMTQASYTAPVIPSSACPALLGLKSLKSHRTVLDLTDNRMILLPSSTPLEIPIGSEVYGLEQATTGHLLLPISEYERLSKALKEKKTPPPKHLFADDAPAEAEDMPPQRRGPSAKARAAAVGPVVGYPAGERNHDHWTRTSDEVVRHHVVPRTNPFDPNGVPGCPVPLQSLTGDRITEMTFNNGTSQIVQDKIGNGDLFAYSQWTGCTRLTIKQNDSDRSMHAGASSSHGPSGEPTAWEVVSPSQ